MGQRWPGRSPRRRPRRKRQIRFNLNSREDYFESWQIAKQIIETKDRVADFIKQRPALIRAYQGAVRSHTTFCPSLRPFRLRFGRNVADAVTDTDHVRLLELRAVNQFKGLLHPRLEDSPPIEEKTGAGDHFGWRRLAFLEKVNPQVIQAGEVDHCQVTLLQPCNR